MAVINLNEFIIIFLQIFSLVILFGLFHGLVLFPVVLSWIGPKPYKQKPNTKVAEEEKLDAATPLT